ncbi:MAG: hypothetical protein U1E41_06095 [Paracoccus sp. (in: a-proteobacteria)]|jgi:hypothetical protein
MTIGFAAKPGAASGLVLVSGPRGGKGEIGHRKGYLGNPHFGHFVRICAMTTKDGWNDDLIV